jgi:hypothetical protein
VCTAAIEGTLESVYLVKEEAFGQVGSESLLPSAFDAAGEKFALRTFRACRVKRLTYRLESGRGSLVVHPRSLKEV